MTTEKSELESFFHSLRSRSESDALEIFQRLRNEPDLLSVLQSVKDGDLLLQATSRQIDDTENPFEQSAITSSARSRQLEFSQSNFTAWDSSRNDVKDTNSNTLATLPMKRKHDKLKSGTSSMDELYNYIHLMPEAAVASVVQKIRSSDNPMSVISFIRHGDPVYQQLLMTPDEESTQVQVRSLDADALQNSRLQLPARPWTIVAGNGIVSHLISNFFDREYSCLEPFVNELAFVTDMVAGEVTKAKYCSPLLVNALCALSAVSLPKAIAIIYVLSLTLLSVKF